MADQAHAIGPPDSGPAARVRVETVELLRLAWPVVLSRLGIMTMGLADAVVVGRFSATELGFHALGWAPTSVVLTLAIGLLMGVQVMTAQAIGDGRIVETGAILRRGVVYGLWIGIASMVALLAGAWPMLHALGLEEGLADGAARAAMVFALSLPPYVLACAAIFWLEAHSRPKPAMAAMWAANVVNVGLLLVFVPGGLGFPAMGAVGAGWATFAARLFLMVVLFAYIARMPEARTWGVFRKPERDRAAEAAQRKVGYGAGASNFFEVAAFASLNVVAGWIGTVALAAWTVVLNVAAVVFMVPLGLAAATAVLVGRAYGARDRAGVVRAGLIGFAVATVFGLVISLAIWPAAGLISAAYTREAEVIAVASTALILTCLFFLADGLQVVIAHALRARGQVWLPTFTHLASYIFVMMPLAWWLALPMGLGVNGIVWSVILASLLSAGLLFGRFWMIARRPL